MNPARKNRRILIALALFAGLIAVGALLLAANDDDHHARNARDDAVAHDAPRTLAANTNQQTLELRAGACVRYRFMLERGVRSRLVTDMNMDGQPATPVEMDARYHVMGEMEIRVHSMGPDGWTGSVSLERIEAGMLQDGRAVRGEWDSYATMLKGGAGLRVDRLGRIVGVTFPQTMNDHARRLYQDLLCQWQVLRTADGSDEWTASDADATGDFQVRYRRLSGAGERPERLERTKLGYDELRRAGNATLELQAEASGKTEILADSLPILIEGDERVRMSDEAGKTSLELTLKFRCERVNVEHRADVAGKANERNGNEVALAPQAGAAQARKLTESEMTGAIDSAMAAIRNSGADEAAKAQAQFQAMQVIVDLLDGQGSAATTLIRQELESNRLTADEASLLIGSLGAAGTTSSQALIRDLLEQPSWTDAQKESAIYAAFSSTCTSVAGSCREAHSCCWPRTAARRGTAIGSVPGRSRSTCSASCNAAHPKTN